AEFAQVVNRDAGVSKPAPEPLRAPPAPAVAPASIVEPAAGAKVNPPEGDDLFAEFANMPAADSENPGRPPDLDTDKMMEEMAALANFSGTGSEESALNESIDTEKMAAEASNLGKS